MNDRTIVGEGTAEPDWLGWLALQNIPRISVKAFCAGYTRLVVVAPHPDDEILACGGLLALCAQMNFPVTVIAVTDGEASHGMTDQSTRARLGQQRANEQREGLTRLGIDPGCVVRLKIPDGGVALHVLQIFNLLSVLLQPGDLVISTWCFDGHPDHESTAQAVLRTSCKLLQAPVWMWHWAQPGNLLIPWSDLVAVDLGDAAVDAKLKALGRHHTQLGRRSAESGPVLSPAIVQRAARRQEYFFASHDHRQLMKETF